MTRLQSALRRLSQLRKTMRNVIKQHEKYCVDFDKKYSMLYAVTHNLNRSCDTQARIIAKTFRDLYGDD